MDGIVGFHDAIRKCELYNNISLSDKELKVKAKFFRLSHDVVTCDVDHNVSTAYC